MKSRVILIFFSISLLVFSSFNSFSQIKFFISKLYSYYNNIYPSQIKPTLQIIDSSKVCDGNILWMGESKCKLMDRKGNTLINLPGNILAFFNDKELVAAHCFWSLVIYNKDLDVIWKNNTHIHHELTITPKENIMLLSDETHSINNINLRFDNILCFDSEGKEIYKWSTFDHLRYLLSFIMKDNNIFRYSIDGSNNPDSVLFNMAPDLTLDKDKSTRELFHMNAIQEIPENKSEKKDNVFREGNILLSFCNYNYFISSFIAIVDPVHFKVLWHYVQKDRKPMHTPAMLPNGHILIYVNSVSNYDSSFIDEIDPITKEVVWSYTEKLPEVELRSGFGSCQRLPNGNTLISNANGYIYEVTPDKKIVWKWFANEKPRPVYRAYWYSKEKLNWLINDK